ncbi:hypothetical protein FE840_002470 [Peteryoungia desertarenae]|uniref:Uncharacterized protein n=1 Tax=Peteryoungia desertarenae TaxID=1813451 RepID=A0ABX6QJT3_9HYPH|nr:hypothetical protein [Peteryoungia desertarenae]QLF68505.1 hypothetical protein FE840_002470 [Peteryoungia desertarenae]
MSFVIYLFQSGWIAVIALVILWAEIALLSVASAAPRKRFMLLLPNTLSGSCLLVALGLALTDGNLFVIAAFLGGSLLSHAVDVASRLAGHASGFKRQTE